MAEYVNLIVLSALAVTLFFGGWEGPWAPLGPLWFVLKLLLAISVFIWIRATVPRPLRPAHALRLEGTAAGGDAQHHRHRRGGSGMTSVASRRRSRLRRDVPPAVQEADHRPVPRGRTARLSTLPRPPPAPSARERVEKCVGCSLCAAACPADCIRVVAEENEPGNRVSPGERYARIYEINMSRCIFCGYCELACPFDAITLGTE